MKTLSEIARRRLANQYLTQTTLVTPADVVGALGAVQAQDFSGAKWAVAQRTKGAVNATVEHALAEGTIVRTHVLRPTWHFVTPADIRWMLALTAPRINAAMAYYNRVLGLDEAVFRRSNRALARALRGGKQLTRAELSKVLERSGIDVRTPRVGHLLMQAELDAVVCSGARRGKQFTYAPFDERVPASPALDRDEALLRLTKTYFATRGPATPNDFAWWSGLTVTDAKRGLHLAAADLEQETIEGRTYWFSARTTAGRKAKSTAHLLPNYDEYFIGFKDRSAIGYRLKKSGVNHPAETFFAHVVAVDGQLVGGWKRSVGKDAAVVQLNLVLPLAEAERRAVNAAARKYEAFLELPVDVREAAQK